MGLIVVVLVYFIVPSYVYKWSVRGTSSVWVSVVCSILSVIVSVVLTERIGRFVIHWMRARLRAQNDS